MLEDGRTAAAYEARGTDYREWRMALFENGEWTHGHPMPGTVNRTVVDINGEKVSKVFALEPLAKQADTAAVTYRNSQGESVFAIAKNLSGAAKNQNWQVEKTYFNVAKAKLQMKPVVAESGKVEAIVVNVKKGASQRLYLWHEGEFRAN